MRTPKRFLLAVACFSGLVLIPELIVLLKPWDDPGDNDFYVIFLTLWPLVASLIFLPLTKKIWSLRDPVDVLLTTAAVAIGLVIARLAQAFGLGLIAGEPFDGMLQSLVAGLPLLFVHTALYAACAFIFWFLTSVMFPKSAATPETVDANLVSRETSVNGGVNSTAEVDPSRSTRHAAIKAAGSDEEAGQSHGFTSDHDSAASVMEGRGRRARRRARGAAQTGSNQAGAPRHDTTAAPAPQTPILDTRSDLRKPVPNPVPELPDLQAMNKETFARRPETRASQPAAVTWREQQPQPAGFRDSRNPLQSEPLQSPQPVNAESDIPETNLAGHLGNSEPLENSVVPQTPRIGRRAERRRQRALTGEMQMLTPERLKAESTSAESKPTQPAPEQAETAKSTRTKSRPDAKPKSDSLAAVQKPRALSETRAIEVVIAPDLTGPIPLTLAEAQALRENGPKEDGVVIHKIKVPSNSGTAASARKGRRRRKSF